MKETFILRALAGSHAHGLETEKSDRDYHGVFSFSTEDVLKLDGVTDSIVRHDPDEAYHELRRFLHLALKCNPTILELLYTEEYEEKMEEWGDGLIDLRSSFLSEPMVGSAYLGYAGHQMKRMKDRTIFKSAKAKKLTRHAFRLLEQGHILYTTGEMSTKVEDRDFYLERLPEWSIDQVIEGYERKLLAFQLSSSVLPDLPDREAVEHYLFEYRWSN